MRRSLKSVALCGTLLTTLVAGGCAREEPGDPAVGVQSEATYPTNRPVTAVGCLVPGETANTYLLMAARMEGSNETQNYQLVPETGMDLQDHVRQRVRVNGTVERRDASHSLTFKTPAETEERPTGTTGETPMVQTHTQVIVDRLSVEQVSPLGEECEI